MEWVLDVDRVANRAVADLRKCAEAGFIVLQNPDGATFSIDPECKVFACGVSFKKAHKAKD